MDIVLFTILFVVMLVLVGANAITYNRDGRMLLTVGFSVGRSMEPEIPNGVTAEVEHYPTTLEEGDCVVYERGSDRILHRIVEVDGDEVRIKGDNNSRSDGWFHKDEIVSKVWGGSNPRWIPLSPSAMKGWVERRRH